MVGYALAALLGGALFTWAVRVIVMSLVSKAWPMADGTVLSSALTSGFGKGGPHYDLTVTYSYRVEGTEYTGDNVDFAGATYSFASSGERRLERYAVGSQVNVYYSPNKPRRSVLEPGFRFSSLYMLVIGGVILVGGIQGLTGHAVIIFGH